MKDALDLCIDRIRHLPPSPTLVTELLALFKQPDRDIDQVVEMIRQDPSLTTEILRRCNSACFAGDQVVEDMFEAVARLGFYEIYCLVVSMFGSQAIAVPEASGGLDVEVLWNHSLTTAVAAGELAKMLDESEGLAFTAGLLHDVGKVILASSRPNDYAQLIQVASSFGDDLLEGEKPLFGFDHCDAGSRLLARWNLPQNVVNAVQHHHHPSAAGSNIKLAAIVHLADRVIHYIKDSNSKVSFQFQDSGESMEILNLTVDNIGMLILQTEVKLERFVGMTSA